MWPNIQILELPFGETGDYRNFTVSVPYNDITKPQQLVEYFHQELTNRYPALRDALHAVCLFAFCFYGTILRCAECTQLARCMFSTADLDVEPGGVRHLAGSELRVWGLNIATLS